jgi:hypothetical protein
MPAASRRFVAAATLVLTPLTACLPYTVGTSAQTVPAGQTRHTTSYYFVPNAFKHSDDSVGAPMGGANYEWRHGLDNWSDVAFRVLPGGVTSTYKRRFGTDTSHATGAHAFSVGAGVVNFGEHFLMEGTLMTSGREDAAITPYGGVRAMHVIPMTKGAVSDRPTVGVFGGAQIGSRWFSVRPELGVFYDHSALGVRESNVIFVPAITLMRGRHREDRMGGDATRGPRMAPLPRLP